MNSKKFHLKGHVSKFGRFFEMSREIPLIAVSWPYHADPLNGYVVQLSPTLKESERFLISLANFCGLTYQEYEEKPKEVNMYDESYRNRLVERNSFAFTPTPLSEFAAGYNAAIRNVKEYGIERVEANANSGTSK
jgi:hypothetical protein